MASQDNDATNLSTELPRRHFLVGGIAGLLSLGSQRVSAQMGAPVKETAPGQGAMTDAAVKDFDPAYVEHVIKPFLRESYYQSETPVIPMIGQAFSKQYALPYDLWGLLYEDWAPSFEEDGLSVFIQGLEERGPDNRRKRIYVSAVTGDLYPMYAGNSVQRLA